MPNPPYVYAAPETRPERRTFDHYSTPPWVIEAALDMVEGTPSRILDPGAGEGQWGKVARQRWPTATIYGIELRDIFAPDAYDIWERADFTVACCQLFRDGPNLIIGNPPYVLAESFVRKGLDLLAPGGELVFLLPLQFLCGQARGRGLWREYPPAEIAFCSKRVSFYGEGKTGSEDYCVVRFRPSEVGPTRVRWIGVDG